MVANIPLKEFTFLKDFSDDQLKKLASLTKEETHPTGAHLYQKRGYGQKPIPD